MKKSGAAPAHDSFVVQGSRGSAAATKTSASTEVIRLIFATFSLPDIILLAYVSVMSACVLASAPGPAQAACMRHLFVHAEILLVGCCAARWGVLPQRAAALVYKAALAAVVLQGYLILRDLLPLVRPDSVDPRLFALDVRLFGQEPSLWLERFNQRPIIEWFSFFYFSYFPLCLTYFVVVCLAGSGAGIAEFAIGTLLVFCIGQLGYVAVPGYGPIRFLANAFTGPVNGGLFWGCVTHTVDAGSAMKDIFPSLHTAVPTWFTCFALWRARRNPRWRWPAVVTGFFALNIIVSTVLLRWHYAIDVLVGLTLGTSVGLLAPRLAAAEASWRARLGVPGTWSFEGFARRS